MILIMMMMMIIMMTMTMTMMMMMIMIMIIIIICNNVIYTTEEGPTSLDEISVRAGNNQFPKVPLFPYQILTMTKLSL